MGSGILNTVATIIENRTGSLGVTLSTPLPHADQSGTRDSICKWARQFEQW